MKFAMILPFASMILGISARAIGAQQIALELADLSIAKSLAFGSPCLDACIDLFMRCSSRKPVAANLLGRMTPDGCKQMFVRCMMNCEDEPSITSKRTAAHAASVRVADDECFKNCDDHFETCDISTAALVNSR
jgi:hypothetical protein